MSAFGSGGNGTQSGSMDLLKVHGVLGMAFSILLHTCKLSAFVIDKSDSQVSYAANAKRKTSPQVPKG